jgi:hypothetical protein
MKRKKDLPSIGDTYAFRLENGKYGACRVLRFVEKDANDKWGCNAVLVACCDWIGDSVPDPANVDLKPILKLTHHRWNSVCVNWITSPVTDSFIRVGTVAPSRSELTRSCDSTVKWSYLPIQRLAQWEWDNSLETEGEATN